MSTELASLFDRAGLRPQKALTESSRQRLFSQLDCPVPKGIETFYQACNGGRIAAIQCRFYPLAEAVGLIAAYDFMVSFRFLPIFVSENNESDPCMVGLDDPLTGYIFQLCHDGPSRILAPNINTLLESISRVPTDRFLVIEDHEFTYPKRLNLAEAKTVKKLLDRSKSGLEIEDEAAVLVELAMSMMTDEECVDVIGEIDHPDHHARHTIMERYRRIGSPAALRAIQNHEKDVRSFVKQAIKILSQNGFTATTTDGLNIHVKEGNSHLNIPMFYDRKESPECWSHLLERVRYFSS